MDKYSKDQRDSFLSNKDDHNKKNYNNNYFPKKGKFDNNNNESNYNRNTFSKKLNNQDNWNNININEYSNKNNFNKSENNANFKNNDKYKRNDFSNNNWQNKSYLGNKTGLKYNINDYYNNKNNSEFNSNKRFGPPNNNSNMRLNLNNNNFNNNFKNNYERSRNFNFKSENNQENLTQLPIYSVKNDIINELKNNRVIIISGNTGCGKSTQVPQFILENFKDCNIVMTQPRRIAATSIAKRLSDERKTNLGDLIGYQVSMISRISKNTKIFVKTTGVFLEELLHNNLDYNYIILDEVHERDIYVDLVLALLKVYFEEHNENEKKIILMSATIAEETFADYLKDINYDKDIPIIKIKENVHKINCFNIEEIIPNIIRDNSISEKLKNDVKKNEAVCYSIGKELPTFSETLFPVVASIIEKIEKENTKNNNGVLIFVPGFYEIQLLQEYLLLYFYNNEKLEFLILHAQISDEEQEKVFKKNNKRKIILATNIAESSITISNIDFVIDFCLVKQNRFDEYQNTSVLELKWCSQSSCQQRKGRTGRVGEGYYFQLITKNSYKKLKPQPIPEIKRVPLETCILKLKIYEKDEEPENILNKTINKPSLQRIINSISRLEKMGALINVKINNNDKEFNYYSGEVTKIGHIFADLPIDVKYSRLIIIAFALGKIDVGITLAAILSQDRSIFLNSDQCNRLNIYNSKNHYCFGKQCDFIACYTAYKEWYGKYGHVFINQKVEYDTRLQHVDKKYYKQIKDDTKNHILDIRVLKEVIRVENDLKKRLLKTLLYSKYFDKGNIKKPENLNKNVFILKLILSGCFYDQIFAAEYDDDQEIFSNIKLNEKQSNNPEYLTIRIPNLSQDEGDKLIEIFEKVIEPDTFSSKKYEYYTNSYEIRFRNVDSLKKILFITSPALKRNKEIQIFEYITDKNKNDNGKINYNNDKRYFIKLSKEPDYTYNLHFYDIVSNSRIMIDKDSINLIQIIPDFHELKKTKFVTDSFVNKSGKSMSSRCTRYCSLLPRLEMFDKFIMLLFAPKYKMVGYKKNEEDKIYEKYIGFQSKDFTYYNNVFEEEDYEQENENNFKREDLCSMFKLNTIKFDYVISNYHLLQINKIRLLINKMIDFQFKTNKEKNRNIDKHDELEIGEFNELYENYVKSTNEIVKEIKDLVDDSMKIRNINQETYENLFDYVQQMKSIEKHNTPEAKQLEKKEKQIKNKSDNKFYAGYINEILQLEKKVKKEYFLQLHEPLKVQDYNYEDSSIFNILVKKEEQIKSLYSDYKYLLEKMKSLAFNKEVWLICPLCEKEICCIKQDSPKVINNNIKEYLIDGAWLDETLPILNDKNKKINQNEIDEFEKNLKNKNIIFEGLFTCSSGDRIAGYIKNKKRYICSGDFFMVKYSDTKIEDVKENDFENNFSTIKEKNQNILKEKEKDEFKERIFCKLCGFHVKKDLKEFKDHLNSKQHKEKMEELKREFI